VLEQHHYRTINRISRHQNPKSNTIEIDWAPTLSIYHSGLNMSAKYNNIKTSTNRTYEFKLNTGNLPTMDKLHQRKPNIYTNNICKICNFEIEDNTHIWNCRNHLETTKLIFHENKNDFLSDLTAKLNQLGISQNTTTNLRNSFNIFPFFAETTQEQQESINTLRSLCSNTQQTEEGRKQRAKLEDLINQTKNTSKEQIIHGLVPTSFSRILGIHMTNITNMNPGKKDEIKKIASTLRTLITNLVWTINQECKERIWKLRCTKTIAWEESHSIRMKQKHQKEPRKQQIHPRKKQIKDASTKLKRKKVIEKDDTDATKRIANELQSYLGLQRTDPFHITSHKIKLSRPNILKTRQTTFDSFKIH
jgi:hypothetical protein